MSSYQLQNNGILPNQNLEVKKVNENQTQYHDHYISGSPSLPNLTASNEQSFKVKSEFKYCDHVSNSETKKYSIWRSKSCSFLVLSCFLNIKQNLNLCTM